jgi:hypothetical protein
MAKFYHLDRGNTLKEGQVVNLIKYNNIECGNDLKLSLELQQHYDRMFPDGVTFHGNQYFVNGNNFAGTNPSIELLFEYVRRSDFPTLPSRFQCFFAVNNLDDMNILINIIGKKYPNYTIWEVECDKFFRGDMNLLYASSSSLGMSYLANKYWKGTTVYNDRAVWEYLLVPPVKVIKKINF